MNTEICDACGGRFPATEGPTHRYMRSSSGCWSVFGEVLAREYGDPAYGALHRLTVDTYAAQHPGTPSPQSIRSVGFHLVRLHLILEHDLDMRRANEAMLAIRRVKTRFAWLAPPIMRDVLSVAHVHGATAPEEHTRRVKEWAASVWAAWSSHHESVRRWSSSLERSPEARLAPRRA